MTCSPNALEFPASETREIAKASNVPPPVGLLIAKTRGNDTSDTQKDDDRRTRIETIDGCKCTERGIEETSVKV